MRKESGKTLREIRRAKKLMKKDSFTTSKGYISLLPFGILYLFKFESLCVVLLTVNRLR